MINIDTKEVCFSKYHALGNDYLVIEPEMLKRELTEEEIRRICHRRFGVGSDGILFGPGTNSKGNFSLRIFNPDGSEAEKSGNGLRIFSRYLWDRSFVENEEFIIDTKGGEVKSVVKESGLMVSVGMGFVRFTHGPENQMEPIKQKIEVNDRSFEYYLANVGNPHCVIFVDKLDDQLAKIYGPVIESDIRFSNRTNVQFVKVIDRSTIQIEIWERGAGYTLASGSSSTAAATVAHVLGHCSSSIDVIMPGGKINISIENELYATMTGAVRKVCEGIIDSEVF